MSMFSPEKHFDMEFTIVRIVQKHWYLMDQCFYLKNNPNMTFTPPPFQTLFGLWYTSMFMDRPLHGIYVV